MCSELTADGTIGVFKLDKSTSTNVWGTKLTYSTVLSGNSTTPQAMNTDIVLDKDNNPIVVSFGRRWSTNHTNHYSVVIHKFDGSNGNLLWARQIEQTLSSPGFTTTISSVPIINSTGNLVFTMVAHATSSLTTSSTTEYGVQYLISINPDGSETGAFGPINISALVAPTTTTSTTHGFTTVPSTRNMANTHNNFISRSYAYSVTDETNNTNFFDNRTEI